MHVWSTLGDRLVLLYIASCMRTEVRSHLAQAGIYTASSWLCCQHGQLQVMSIQLDLFFTDLYPSISTYCTYMHTHIHGHISLQKGITPCHMQLDVGCRETPEGRLWCRPDQSRCIICSSWCMKCFSIIIIVFYYVDLILQRTTSKLTLQL